MLSSDTINWAPYCIEATQDPFDGKWATGQSWCGVYEGAIDLVPIAEDVPIETKAKIEKVKKGVKDSSFVSRKGPVLQQDGKEGVSKGAVPDDKFLSGENFDVEGMEGKVPGDKKEARPQAARTSCRFAFSCRGNT